MSGSSRSVPRRVSRSAPEWVTFAVSAAVLLVVVVALVALSFQTREPARPVARTAGAAREVDGRYFVPVQVVNQGDEGAAEVQVSVELTIDGEVTTGDQVIDFLGGGETQAITFVLDQDPDDGELVVGVTGFADP